MVKALDHILLQGMVFYGYHGVLPEETRLGQKFIIDIVLWLDTCPAGQADALELSVSYAAVYENIRQILEGQPYQLIEAVAEKIAEVLLSGYPLLQEVEVTVKKPEAPVKGIFDYFGVSINRGRHG